MRPGTDKSSKRAHFKVFLEPIWSTFSLIWRSYYKSADMRLDRAGSIGLRVGPLTCGSKIDEKGDEQRHILQELFLQTLFAKK